MPATTPIDNTWGAVLIGVWMGTLLYGVVSLQTYIYYQHYPKDTLYLKSIVGSVWFLDTLHTIFVTHMIFSYLISDFGDYNSLAINTWSFNAHVLVTTLVAAISQLFFIYRCWRFDKSLTNSVLSLIITSLAIIQLCFGIACAGLTFTLHEFSEFLRFTWVVDTWLGAAAAVDILVSVAIVRSLWKSRTGVRRTNNLIHRLILWTVKTGLITSLWAILDIALFTGSKTTLIHDLFNVMLAKLYANTLLATLNQRKPHVPIGDSDPDVVSSSISLANVGGLSMNAHSQDGASVHVHALKGGVRVSTHIINDTDSADDSPVTFRHSGELDTIGAPSVHARSVKAHWMGGDPAVSQV